MFDLTYFQSRVEQAVGLLHRDLEVGAGGLAGYADRKFRPLAAKGYMARGGQIIDAVSCWCRRGAEHHDDAELPLGARQRVEKQKPADAGGGPRWRARRGAWPPASSAPRSHVNATPAPADAALCRDHLLPCTTAGTRMGCWTQGSTCNDVFADGAYRSAEVKSKLRASGYNSPIHRRARRNHPLSLAQVRVNHAKSRIRARIEHVFGARQNTPGGPIVRTIGIVRARAKIGLQNLAYNIRRLVTLERLAAA